VRNISANERYFGENNENFEKGPEKVLNKDR